MLKNGNFTFLLLEIILADELADLPPPVVVKNGDFTFLLLEIILADQLANLPPPLVVRNGNFIFLLLEAHIGRCSGRSTGRSNPQ